ncbi:MAG: SDR family oxidoreductase [bacterium]|nr:SDR family oxidoreductase [bacterium]
MRIDGSVALVTGAARRVGRAVALELSEAGCDVAVHYHHSRREAEEVVEQIERQGRRANVVDGDLADPQTWSRVVDACVDRFGRLDVLVNNASVYEPMRVEDFNPEAWDRTMRVNLTAAVGMCHHAVEPLRAGGRGCIVNILDIGAERPFRGYLAYSCSKAGLAALTRGLAVELAPEIRVNAVSPGIAVFPEDCDEATRARLIDRVPMGRAGSPEDIARAVRYLVAEAGFVTGQVLGVDGGRSVRW